MPSSGAYIDNDLAREHHPFYGVVIGDPSTSFHNSSCPISCFVVKASNALWPLLLPSHGAARATTSTTPMAAALELNSSVALARESDVNVLPQADAVKAVLATAPPHCSSLIGSSLPQMLTSPSCVPLPATRLVHPKNAIPSLISSIFREATTSPPTRPLLGSRQLVLAKEAHLVLLLFQRGTASSLQLLSAPGLPITCSVDDTQILERLASHNIGTKEVFGIHHASYSSCQASGKFPHGSYKGICSSHKSYQKIRAS